jgi:2-C-methyl-D-erythritol 4-phosphate cytidylyltransferase
MTCTIVLAAGSGARFGTRKQYLELGGIRAVDRVVTTARAATDAVVVVLPPGDVWSGPPVDAAVAGGATRAASVRAGLTAVPLSADVVVVHDAAHPLATPELFRAVLAALRDGPDGLAGPDGAVPVLPVTEALKRVAGARVVGSLAKDQVVLAQTPQAFRADVLRRVHVGEPEAVEDVELVVGAGGDVRTILGDPRNIHVTTTAELAVAELLLGDAA